MVGFLNDPTKRCPLLAGKQKTDGPGVLFGSQTSFLLLFSSFSGFVGSLPVAPTAGTIMCAMIKRHLHWLLGIMCFLTPNVSHRTGLCYLAWDRILLPRMLRVRPSLSSRPAAQLLVWGKGAKRGLRPERKGVAAPVCVFRFPFFFFFVEFGGRNRWPPPVPARFEILNYQSVHFVLKWACLEVRMRHMQSDGCQNSKPLGRFDASKCPISMAGHSKPRGFCSSQILFSTKRPTRSSGFVVFLPPRGSSDPLSGAAHF